MSNQSFHTSNALKVQTWSKQNQRKPLNSLILGRRWTRKETSKIRRQPSPTSMNPKSQKDTQQKKISFYPIAFLLGEEFQAHARNNFSGNLPHPARVLNSSTTISWIPTLIRGSLSMSGFVHVHLDLLCSTFLLARPKLDYCLLTNKRTKILFLFEFGSHLNHFASRG